MPDAHRTIVIHRPPPDVFAFFADPRNDGLWRTHVRSIRADGPSAVGSRVAQVVEGPGGRGIAADFVVTAYEPPVRYAFQVVVGPARPRGEFRLAAQGTATEVAFSLRSELRGVARLMLSRPIRRSMEAEMADLDRARAILEAPVGSDVQALGEDR